MMASGRASLRLSINLDSQQITRISEAINKYKKNLANSKDRKVQWLSDLKDLKNFVYDIVGEGKWCSPGGNSKLFHNDQISITWYPNKKTLLFQGRMGNTLKELIGTLLTSKTTALEEHDADADVQGFPSSPQNLSAQLRYSLEQNNGERTTSTNCVFDLDNSSKDSPTNQPNCNCSCGEVLDEIGNMKLNMEILQSRLDSLQSLANIQQLVFAPTDDHTNRIEKLESELVEERRRINQYESEIDLLLRKLSECEDKLILNDSNSTKKINLTLGKTPFKPDVSQENDLLEISCRIVQADDAMPTNNANSVSKNANSFDKQLEEYQHKHKRNSMPGKSFKPDASQVNDLHISQSEEAKSISNNANSFNKQLEEYQKKRKGIYAQSNGPRQVNKNANPYRKKRLNGNLRKQVNSFNSYKNVGPSSIETSNLVDESTRSNVKNKWQKRHQWAHRQTGHLHELTRVANQRPRILDQGNRRNEVFRVRPSGWSYSWREYLKFVRRTLCP